MNGPGAHSSNYGFSRGHISKPKRCFTVKSSTHYFHGKTNFQIYISIPLIQGQKIGAPVVKQLMKVKSMNLYVDLINTSKPNFVLILNP